MNDEKPDVAYIGLFYLRAPQRQHANLTPALQTVARDVKVIPLGSNCVMYLLVSKVHPHTFPMGHIMHTGDQYVWAEIGEYVTTHDFNSVQGWIDSHRPRG